MGVFESSTIHPMEGGEEERGEDARQNSFATKDVVLFERFT